MSGYNSAFPPWSPLPRWSPDGKQIAFAKFAPDRHLHIFLVSADGGSPQQLTFTDRDESTPTWLPDSNSLAYGCQGAPIRVLNSRDPRGLNCAWLGGHLGPLVTERAVHCRQFTQNGQKAERF